MSSRTTVLASLFAIATSLAACSKKERAGEAPPSAGSATTGSATTGSATTGSATTGSADGSGSAGAGDVGSAGSAAAGSGDVGSAGSDAAGSDAAGSGSAGAGSAAAAGAGTESAFDKLSHEEKRDVMKKKVMPAMKAAFQKFDPKEFANFTCKTCHGKDPKKSKYEMPTKDLPALDFDELDKGHDKEIAKFMTKVVRPQMAKILGEPEASASNPDGFSCLDCHTEKKK